eukprot:EG_transcript_26485
MGCFALGELIGQLAAPSPTVAVGPLLFMSLYGLLLAAPLGHYWYQALERWAAARGLEGAVGVAVKVMMDQLVYTPPTTLLFFTCAKLWQASPPWDAAAHALRLCWPTLKAGWSVWPLVHLFSFAMVPTHFRVSFLSMCTVFWAVFLSVTKQG